MFHDESWKCVYFGVKRLTIKGQGHNVCVKDHQNTLRWWSKHAYNKYKMADGRHFVKTKNRNI